MQEFTRQIAWVVMLALAFSLIEALLILPAHLSTIKPINSQSKIARLQARIAASIVNFGNNRYGPLLERAVARPVLTMILFCLPGIFFQPSYVVLLFY